jgi:hypothetical protein
MEAICELLKSLVRILDGENLTKRLWTSFQIHINIGEDYVVTINALLIERNTKRIVKMKRVRT